MKRFLILILALMLLLCACDASVPQEKDKTTTAMERYIAEASEPTPTDEQPASEGRKLEEVLFGLARYEIKAVEENVCEITVTAPDMDRLIDRMNKKCDTAEEGTAFLLDALQDGDFEFVTNIVRVELDENGKPIETYEFVDAMYGGLLSKFEELLQEVRGDE